ncbi:hypothetical protein ACJ41O_005650 [Fusarium nematophilum]
MASASGLCEFCNEIDFDMLRLPTVNEIQLLNAGHLPADRYPYKFITSGPDSPTWSLGVGWKSTRGEADTDVFYYLRRLRLTCSRLSAGEQAQPGPCPYPALQMRRLFGCFQTYQPEVVVVREDDDSTRRRPDHDEGEGILFGARERPAMLDQKLPAQWLHDCLTDHTKTCGATETQHMPVSLFRLLHIQERKVVDFHNIRISQLKYAALSYVWGGNQRTTLQRSNYARLHSSGSLARQVSRTIEDSFHLTEALGVEYLWVDALCIIQDDDADKAVQISNMGNMYSNSLFTIIAAAGSGAEAGLPGVRVPRTARQKEVLVRATDSGLSMSLVTTLRPLEHDFTHYTKETAWASRGWTIQERILSRRVIMVLKEQILWACGQSHWAEERNCETRLARVSWFSLHESEYLLNSSVRNWHAFDDEDDQLWYKLRHLVLDYTGRKLTVEGDALDAFSAILQQVKEKTGEHFLWGIPATRFELGMCWEASQRGVGRRTCLSTLEMTTLKRLVPFPSWSWMGWKGEISLRVEDRYLELGLDPQILCYIFRNSPPRLVRVSRLSADSSNARQQPAIAISNSPLAVTLQDVRDHCPGLSSERLVDTPDDQLLFFWAQSGVFLVSKPVEEVPPLLIGDPLLEDKYKRHYRKMTDADGNVVGRTTACEAVSDDEVNESGECEFILIANNTPPQHEEERIAMTYSISLAKLHVYPTGLRLASFDM